MIRLVLGSAAPPRRCAAFVVLLAVAVRGLRVAGRTLDWSWATGRLTVTVHGAPLRVRAGAPFPRSTRLDVSIR
ncbi:MAG: hypothetical protein ACREIB_13250 [Pseudomonadota bacterium]